MFSFCHVMLRNGPGNIMRTAPHKNEYNQCCTSKKRSLQSMVKKWVIKEWKSGPSYCVLVLSHAKWSWQCELYKHKNEYSVYNQCRMRRAWPATQIQKRSLGWIVNNWLITEWKSGPSLCSRFVMCEMVKEMRTAL